MLKQILNLQLVVLLLLGSAVPALALDRFADQGNGSVWDNYSKLRWIKDPNVVPALSGEKSWADASQACAELVYAGKGPATWRLPRIQELKELIDENFSNPQINTNFFSAEGSHYWSKTPYRPGVKAWTVNFKNGALGSRDKFSADNSAVALVRCVSRS
ncbi:MAG: hypothetical protein ACI9CF_001076 [Candidatus Omnitrophota bacterium]|jgi:hypothetical protein